MRNRVVITGLGSINPVGNNVPETWQNLVAGHSGVSRITHYDPSKYECQIAGEVKNFNPATLFGSKEVRRMDRYCQFALAATQEACQQSRLEINDSNRDRVGVLIGSGIGGIGTLFDQVVQFIEKGPSRVSPFLVPMMLADSASGIVAINMGARGPNMAVVTACATGTNAVGEAAEIIRRGEADVMISGGSEAAIVPVGMAGLSNMGALSSHNSEPERASRPFDKNRDGFIMAEGAAILILESLEFAQARGAKILAEISGYATTNDAFHISAPAENGAGAALCMRNALQDARLGVKDIQYINAHGTSTPLNDKSETAAIKSVFGEQAYHIPVSSTKSMTGHLLGASGALEALISVKVLEEAILPPTINYETPDPLCDLDYVPNVSRPAEVEHVMSNSFGFGGHNATVIISQLDPSGAITNNSD